MIAAKTGARGPVWFLLDLLAAPKPAQHYRTLEHRGRYRLFEQTVLAGLSADGPLLLALEPDSGLWRDCHEQPNRWPGLFLVSRAGVSVLLEHLRGMLQVGFSGHYQGVLSYYNPQTASYFFDATDADELSSWLGPIEQLYWHGGTWADKAAGSLGWQQVLNPERAVPPLHWPAELSDKQQGRLQECILERHAYRWSGATETAYALTWKYLHEGLALGFTQGPVLDGWLRLRRRYPVAQVPEVLPGLTAQERLDNLRRYWQPL